MKPNKQKTSWGSMEWLLDGEQAKVPDISVAKMRLNPKSISENHYHKNCYEFLMVEQGNIILFIDDRSYPLKAGQSFLIAPDCCHFIENLDNDFAEMILTFSSHQRNYTPLGIS